MPNPIQPMLDPKSFRRAFRSDAKGKRGLAQFFRYLSQLFLGPTSIINGNVTLKNEEAADFSYSEAFKGKNLGNIYLGGIPSRKKLAETKPIVFSLTTRDECETNKNFIHPDKPVSEAPTVYCQAHDHGFVDPTTGNILSLSKLSQKLEEFQQLRENNPKKDSLFHCWGGAGRSAAAFIMWMTKYLGILPNDAAIYIHQKRSAAKLLHKGLNKLGGMNRHGLSMIGCFYYRTLAENKGNPQTDSSPLENLINSLKKAPTNDQKEKIVLLNLDLIFRGNISNMEAQDYSQAIQDFQTVRKHISEQVSNIDILKIIGEKILKGEDLISLVNLAIIANANANINMDDKKLCEKARKKAWDILQKKERSEDTEKYLTPEMVIDMFLTDKDTPRQNILAWINQVHNPNYLTKILTNDDDLKTMAWKRLKELCDPKLLTPQQFVHLTIQINSINNHNKLEEKLNINELQESYSASLGQGSLSLLIRNSIEKNRELDTLYLAPSSPHSPSPSPTSSPAKLYTSTLTGQQTQPLPTRWTHTIALPVVQNVEMDFKNLSTIPEAIKAIKSEGSEEPLFTACVKKGNMISMTPNPDVAVKKIERHVGTYKFVAETPDQKPAGKRLSKSFQKTDTRFEYHHQRNEFLIKSKGQLPTEDDIRKFVAAFLAISQELNFTHKALDISDVPKQIMPTVKKCLTEAHIEIVIDPSKTPMYANSGRAKGN